MKYLKLSTWAILLATFSLLTACDDEQELNLNLTEVETLYTPEDDLFVQLKPAQSFSHTFEWSSAHAEDGSLVLYEVAFDHEGGDFSQPFYTTVSNGKGVERKLTLSHADLNKIATLAGADFFEKVKLRWTVLAAKGSNIKPALESRTIELERPGGFAVLPADLYITGSATEGGTSTSSALKMKQNEPGKFEIYTKLTSGTYKFLDGTGAGARSFYIKDEDGAKVIGTNSETTYSESDKVFRVRIDFNSLGVEIDEVKSVGFWYCWENKILYDLSYAGGGIWSVEGVTVNLSPVPWGLEERHKYKVVLNDGASDKEEWWGYVSDDSPGQDGKYGTAPASYFYAYKIASNNQWNHAFKLDRNAVQGKVCDFFLKFTTDAPYATDYVVH